MSSGIPLTEKERSKLFNAWMEFKTVQGVVRKCHVSSTTVNKYRRLDKWREREEDIRRKAHQKADDKVAYTLSKELKATNVFIASLISKIAKFIDDEKLEPDMREFRELVRLKKELLEVVEPDLPAEPEIDKVGELLKKLSEVNLDNLVATATKQLSKSRSNVKSK